MLKVIIKHRKQNPNIIHANVTYLNFHLDLLWNKPFFPGLYNYLIALESLHS